MTNREDYLDIDFRKNPEKYKIAKGEQGVLMAEPYKSEILPFWRFKTPDIASVSAKKIYNLFLNYLSQKDFVGSDMARKFLQMGWTRSRRYANHSSGKKYKDNQVLPQSLEHDISDKAQSAQIFKEYYDLARTNETYLKYKKQHKVLETQYAAKIKSDEEIK